mmetsp:Transcript_5444/g.18775  ORF Transcript_5444/g.18775 Transcript_5444/m.18775 type:complete len:209 (+) Transcript_5444:291-917(+)
MSLFSRDAASSFAHVSASFTSLSSRSSFCALAVALSAFSIAPSRSCASAFKAFTCPRSIALVHDSSLTRSLRSFASSALSCAAISAFATITEASSTAWPLRPCSLPSSRWSFATSSSTAASFCSRRLSSTETSARASSASSSLPSRRARSSSSESSFASASWISCWVELAHFSARCRCSIACATDCSALRRAWCSRSYCFRRSSCSCR